MQSDWRPTWLRLCFSLTFDCRQADADEMMAAKRLIDNVSV